MYENFSGNECFVMVQGYYLLSDSLTLYFNSVIMCKRKWITFLIINLIGGLSFLKAQSGLNFAKADSIQVVLKRQLSDTAKSHFLYESMKNFYNYATSDADYKLAEKCIFWLDSLSGQTGNPAIITESFLAKSAMEFRKGNAKESFSNSKMALVWVQKTKDKKLLARTYDNVADAYYTLENWNEALTYYLLALRYFELTHDQIRVGYVYGDIAEIFILQNEFNKAVLYANKSVSLFHQAGTAEQLSVAYYQLAAATAGLGNAKAAIAYQQKANNYFRDIHDLSNEINGLNNLAEYYSRSGDQNKAIESVLKSIEMEEKFGNATPKRLIAKYLNLGIFYEKKGDYTKAETALNKSIDFARQIQSPLRLMESYEALAEVYLKTGKIKQASLLYPALIALKDTVFKANKTKEIFNLNIQYETEKKELEINQLQQENKTQQWTISLIGAGSALAVLVAFLLYRAYVFQKKLNEQNKILAQQEKTILETNNDKLQLEKDLENEKNRGLQSEIEIKQRELISATVYIQQKNEMLDTLQNQLYEAASTEGDNRDLLKRMSRSVRQQIRFEDDWEKIKVHFEGVHPDFFHRLQALSSALSDHELRHCAYIKMKFSTKEIAGLLGIDANSVKVSRYRIKKKILGDLETDLTEFIQKI
jgi:tetratricopeptide (TPR) repeat protein